MNIRYILNFWVCVVSCFLYLSVSIALSLSAVWRVGPDVYTGRPTRDGGRAQGARGRSGVCLTGRGARARGAGGARETHARRRYSIVDAPPREFALLLASLVIM